MFTLDAQQALGFLQSQTAHIEAQVYEIQYPDIQYDKLVPIDTSAFEWARTVEFYSMDKVGKADWFHHLAKDMPKADVERTKHTHGVQMAGIGYGYSLEELGQAMMIPGMNLSADRAAAARRAYEEFMDNLVLYGDSDKGFDSLLTSALPTAVTAAATGTGSSTEWEDKTGDQIAADVNNALAGIYTNSLTVELADTVLLPIVEMLRLANTRMDANGSDMSILEWITKHNVYTFQTGQLLTVRGVRGLDTAAGGTTGRMVAYRRDPGVLKVHMPMAHRFLPVWQTGPIMFDVPGIFRTGGLEIRRPGAIRYVDGISDTSTS